MKLTGKQEAFCQEYVKDYNATRAATDAGYSKRTAGSIGSENLQKPEIKERIAEIQANLAELANITPLMVLQEFAKIAFSNMSDFKAGWMTEKDFEMLTEDQKAALSEISTVERVLKKNKKAEVTQVMIKFKLHDKQKALENINKMLGFNQPDKVDHTTLGKEINIPPIRWVGNDDNS